MQMKSSAGTTTGSASAALRQLSGRDEDGAGAGGCCRCRRPAVDLAARTMGAVDIRDIGDPHDGQRLRAPVCTPPMPISR